MKRLVLVLLLLLAMTVPAMAKTAINVDTLNQDDFKAFSTDFGLALSYQPLSPAAPLGGGISPGFDVGVEGSYVKLDKSSLYYQKINAIVNATNAGNLPSYLVIPRVHAQVGLPIVPIDLGVSYSTIPDSGIKLVGYELKYAVFSGGVVMPAVAIRGAYTKLSGLDALDLSTTSADISISKGILIFTPYAGASEVWITSTPHSTYVPISLTKENIRKPKVFVGTKVKVFPFVNLDIEADFAKINEYSARLNVNF